MKRYIQGHYTLTGYDPRSIDDFELRQLIQGACDAVPDEITSDLYALWKDRCQAVIETRRNSTRYYLVLLLINLILI